MMILLTGGSACGKSSFAETLCQRFSMPRFYLAAMRPYGDGSEEKIARHRRMRADKGFQTIERYNDYAALQLPKRGCALLECICNLTANEMFDESGQMSDPYDKVIDGVSSLCAQCEHLIIVTNDVGSDCKHYDSSTTAYIHALGRINAALAAQADCVCELVCGIPILLKGELLL